MGDEEEEEAEEGEAVVGEIFSKKKSYPLIVSFFTFVYFFTLYRGGGSSGR